MLRSASASTTPWLSDVNPMRGPDRLTERSTDGACAWASAGEQKFNAKTTIARIRKHCIETPPQAGPRYGAAPVDVLKESLNSSDLGSC